MPAVTPYRFSSVVQAALEACWRKANAPEAWGVTREQLQAALERSIAHRFCGTLPEPKFVASYLETLHVEDLALACACSTGNPAAWDYFVAKYRPELYRAARAIAGSARGDEGTLELADSLYADLYGLRDPQGQRKPLLDYFHGRSKLGTWLRALLAQRFVDEYRRARRIEPLDEPANGDDRGAMATANALPDPERGKYLAMLQAALTAALDALAPRDRLRLAYYYIEELTLAQIGRLIDEHEATVSRHLDRTRHGIRRRIEAALREKKKLSEAQLRLCYEYAREEWPFDLTRVLSARD
jgi:RNA polymerase sigma-70 factor (ECF subfamily)